MHQLIAYWVIIHAFLRLLTFFQNKFFEKILSGIPSECQTVWTLIRPNELSGLIWVQIVCQDYQQKTLVDKELSADVCRSIAARTKALNLLFVMESEPEGICCIALI